MINQTAETVNPPQGVPFIVEALIDAMKRSGGLQTEGIFRISTRPDLLRSLRSKFEGGDYIVSGQHADPHVCGCLLKEWLRNLPEPLIPAAMRDRALDLSHKSKEKGPNCVVVEGGAMEQFLLELPKANRVLIYRLLDLFLEVAFFGRLSRSMQGNLT